MIVAMNSDAVGAHYHVSDVLPLARPGGLSIGSHQPLGSSDIAQSDRYDDIPNGG